MRISDWSSDVCSSDLHLLHVAAGQRPRSRRRVGAANVEALDERAGVTADGAAPQQAEAAAPWVARGFENQVFLDRQFADDAEGVAVLRHPADAAALPRGRPALRARLAVPLYLAVARKALARQPGGQLPLSDARAAAAAADPQHSALQVHRVHPP